MSINVHYIHQNPLLTVSVTALWKALTLSLPAYKYFTVTKVKIVKFADFRYSEINVDVK